jgi:hypothetical protein
MAKPTSYSSDHLTNFPLFESPTVLALESYLWFGLFRGRAILLGHSSCHPPALTLMLMSFILRRSQAAKTVELGIPALRGEEPLHKTGSPSTQDARPPHGLRRGLGSTGCTRKGREAIVKGATLQGLGTLPMMHEMLSIAIRKSNFLD